MTGPEDFLAGIGRGAVLAALVAGLFLLASNHALHLARTREWICGERLRVYTGFMQFLDATPHRLVALAARPLARIAPVSSVNKETIAYVTDLYERLNELELVASRRVLDEARNLTRRLASDFPQVAKAVREAPQEEESTPLMDGLLAARGAFDEIIGSDRKRLRDAMRKDLRTNRRRA